MAVRGQYQISGASANAIAASIEAEIAAGRLPAGAELPSVRALAAQRSVSPATVAAAYRTLRGRGTVVSAERRGVRVAGRPPLAARGVDPLPAGVRDLATGNPDPDLLPPLPPLRGAGVPRLYGESVNLPALLERAREAFAADGVDGARVAVTSGALDGVERVLAAHLRPGDRVAVEDPGYPGVHDLARVLGLELVGVDVDGSGMRPEPLAAAVARGVDAVVLTPCAQNPFGAALDAERAAELAGVLDRAPGALLVEDDHAGPVAGAAYRTLSAGRERWAVVRSVSKSLGPDLRLAVVAGDGATLGRVEGRQRLGPGWVSHLLQRAVAELWTTSDAAFASAAATYAARREALLAALADCGVQGHGRSGLNVWVPVREEGLVVRGLLARGWAVQAGEAYRLAGPPAVRVTVAALPEPDAERLAADLATLLRAPQATNRA